MVRNSVVIAAALALGLAVDASPVAAQTFEACRVPSVGVIYMINVGDAPTACLDPSHVQFSWTEGGAPPDGSVTTAKLADAAVTPAKLVAGIVPGGNLPSGSTIRGFWGQGFTADAAGEFAETYIAFGWTLASAPTAHFMALGSAPTAACPGSSTNPLALPGNLCVYEDNTGNMNGKAVCSSGTCTAATRFGAQIRGNAAAAGSAWMRGAWAVTAP
jgi:hypothetical protein